MKGIICVFVLCLFFSGCVGLYGPQSAVIPLTKENFANRVFGTEHVWLVEFFAPWCGHCKKLAPDYDKAASNLKGIVRVGAVNCDEQKDLCGSFGVQGYPTIKLFPSTLKEVPNKKGNYYKEPEDYNSERSAAALVKFAVSKLPSFYTAVTSANHEKFLSQELPKVLLFTNKDKTSDLYKALAVDYHHGLALGEVKHTDKKLVDLYKITTFPTLLVLQDSGEHAIFEGKLGHDTLFKFLEPFAKFPQREPPTQKAKEPEPEQETGEIFEITEQSVFDEKCVNKGGLCVLAFLDPENTEETDQKKYIALLKDLGEKYKGKFRIFWLNSISEPDFTHTFDVSAIYPNLVVISPKKLRYTPFRRAFEEEPLEEFLDSVLRGKGSIPFDKLPTVASSGAKKADEKKKTGEKEEL